MLLVLLLAGATAMCYTTRLAQAPRYLARDEIGFGRQAYSFATTGRDLDGNRFPLFFGEPIYHVGRDPLLIYLTALLLKVRPLSDAIVRLPNALLGVLDVLLMFLVGRRIFKNEWLGLGAALILAMSPAHFIHSRLAVSLLLPLPFTLLWLLTLTGILERDTPETKHLALRPLGIGAACLGLGVYGYLASVMLMPIYLICTAWVAATRDIAKRIAVLAVAFVVPMLPLVFWQWTHPTRFHDMIAIYHPYAPQFGPLQGLKEMLSYFSLSVRADNYWTNLNPSLLFFGGDASLVNSTRLAGVFLWPIGVFFAAGVYQMLTARRSRFTGVLLIGFLTAPLPQVLTVDVGIRRSLVLIVFGTLIATYGIEYLLAQSRPTLTRVAAALMLAIVPFSFAHFYRDYVGDYQNRAAYWFGNNIRGMMEALMALRPSAAPIYLSNKVPYLDEYWPYYTAMHAREDLLPDTHYYTPDTFDPTVEPSRSLLVVAVNEQPSPEVLQSNGWQQMTVVTEPTGQPVFVIYEKRR